MDQSVELDRRAAASLRPSGCATSWSPSIDAAPRRRDSRSIISNLDHVFPDDVYAAMLAAMPEARDYRPMHGRSKGHDLADGTHTRVKIDLFPEYIRHLPAGEACALGRRRPRAVLAKRVKRLRAPARARRSSAASAADFTPRPACIRSRS